MNLAKPFLLLTFILLSMFVLGQAEKTRLIILADMGNEPDEEQQIAHLLMYSNEFDLEGLIAVSGKFLHSGHHLPERTRLYPELFHNIINAYALDLDNLKKHATGWPDPDYLQSIVSTGQPDYGVAGMGVGKSTPGSDLIIKCVEKDDARPLYVVVNAGSNTLAQAITDYEASHSKEELEEFIAKLRVFENGAQDDAGAWICANYPGIHWIRSNVQTYCYGGPDFDRKEGEQNDESTRLGPYTWEPYAYSAIGQHQWALEHIKGDHGHMGVVWPLRQTKHGRIVYLEGGGTIPWMGLIHRGLSDISHPGWGGWSGRFTREKVKNVYSKHASVEQDEVKYGGFAVFTEAVDRWVNSEDGTVYDNNFAPVWRWRRAMYNDFACRMDWCVESYENTNHNPVAAINGDATEVIHFRQAKVGEVVSFDASATVDPDDDQLEFNWWIYKEAGTYAGNLELSNLSDSKVSFTIPDNAKGREIHLILEVIDDNEIASMYDYRRVVIKVE